MSVDHHEFKDAMSRLSAHVTIVTAYGADRRPRGFTASAVCSLSLRPPLVLVCISRASSSHDVFVYTEHFAVNVLRESHRDLAQRFATSGVDRFDGTDFESGSHAPYLPDGLSVLNCVQRAAHPGGDHTIVIGEVDSVTTSLGEPLMYFDRRFCGLSLTPSS
jgi:flavin reductase ActVB